MRGLETGRRTNDFIWLLILILIFTYNITFKDQKQILEMYHKSSQHMYVSAMYDSYLEKGSTIDGPKAYPPAVTIAYLGPVLWTWSNFNSIMDK